MRIFLSWSGNTSNYLASCFKEWLPNVLQYIEPYMSEKDIRLGERWGKNIEENLRSNDFGLVFVTPENIDAPWINFEAGALSKSLQSRLVPILYKSEVTILNSGPLKQFQSSKETTKESIKQLVVDINEYATESECLKADRVECAFEKWWDELEEKLKEVPDPIDKVNQEKPTSEEILNVILSEVKNLSDGTKISGGIQKRIVVPKGLIDDLKEIKLYLEKIEILMGLDSDETNLDLELLQGNIMRMEKIIKYLINCQRRERVHGL